MAWLIWHRGQDLLAWYTSNWPRYTSIWTLVLDYSFQEDLNLRSPYSIVRGSLVKWQSILSLKLGRAVVKFSFHLHGVTGLNPDKI